MRVVLTVDLAPLRAAACDRVDAEAERERARYATAGALQAMTYQAKAAEAAAFAAGAVGPFPLLEAEAEATASTVEVLAAVVAATAAQWTVVTAAIEAKRMGAKKAIREASTPAAIEAAAGVDWTVQG